MNKNGNEIRVQYSGFIIFTAQILSVITGLAFTLLLTRNMSVDQYGVWTFIYSIIGPFTLLSGVFPFWATRFVARGKEGAVKTAVSANLIIGLVSTVIYLSVISTLLNVFNVSSAYLLVYALASLQILNTFLITILESCLRSIRPQVIGYGLLIEEVIKVALAFIIAVGLNQLFLGAMIGLIGGAFIQALFYIWLLIKELKQKIQWNYLREWLKGSTAFIYNSIGGQLIGLVLYVLFLFGGPTALGNYQAAVTFANIVGYSVSVAFALYPVILANNSSVSQVKTTFRAMMMLAIPLAAITIVMSGSFLTVLNTAYVGAWPVLILLTFDTLIAVVTQFYSYILLGSEAFDEEGKIPLGKLVKSKIFKVFTIPYIQAAVALPLAYFVLTQLPINGAVQAASYITAICIGVHASTLAGLYWFMRGSAKIPVAWKSIGKYVAVSIVAGVVLYLLPNPSTLVLTLAKTVLGIAVYACLLLAIDKQARKIVRSVIEEIRIVIK